MMNYHHFKISLLLVVVLFVQSSFARDVTRWGLPEGAKARLAKGKITGNVTYSPDGTQLYFTLPEVAFFEQSENVA